MTDPVPINLAVEDELSEAVLRVILHQTQRRFAIGRCYNRQGFGYLRKTIHGFNRAAKGTPFLVLTDLDKAPCPPDLIAEWLPVSRHHNLLFRVAVKQVEAWVMGDYSGFAHFLGIRRDMVPVAVDAIQDSKRFLIDLARQSPRRDLRDDIVPPPDSTRKQGPNYNGRLIGFVQDSWNALVAQERSPSLQHTLRALEQFKPKWSGV